MENYENATRKPMYLLGRPIGEGEPLLGDILSGSTCSSSRIDENMGVNLGCRLNEVGESIHNQSPWDRQNLAKVQYDFPIM